jgi:Skp family chaperone for outer membrane proteins
MKIKNQEKRSDLFKKLNKMIKSILKTKNIHLGMASVTVFFVGFSYGICPNKIMPFFFDFIPPPN